MVGLHLLSIQNHLGREAQLVWDIMSGAWGEQGRVDAPMAARTSGRALGGD